MLKMFFSMIFTLFIFFLFIILSKNIFLNKEKISPFECGFEPFSLSRVPFSLRFFKITLIFLIFDIEIIMILSFCLSNYSPTFFFYLNMNITISLILLSTLYEWYEGNLDWIKLMSI